MMPNMVFNTWDMKMGYAYQEDSYTNVTYANFTFVEHITMSIKITTFRSINEYIWFFICLVILDFFFKKILKI